MRTILEGRLSLVFFSELQRQCANRRDVVARDSARSDPKKRTRRARWRRRERRAGARACTPRTRPGGCARAARGTTRKLHSCSLPHRGHVRDPRGHPLHSRTRARSEDAQQSRRHTLATRALGAPLRREDHFARAAEDAVPARHVRKGQVAVVNVAEAKDARRYVRHVR